MRLDAGRPGDPLHDAPHPMPVDRSTVVSHESAVTPDVVEIGRRPRAEQFDELGVQRDVAVVAELADGDAQPVPVADAHDRIGLQAAKLAGAQTGAGKRLDHEAITGIGGGACGGHDLGGVAVVEELGQRLRAGRQVATDDRVARRRVRPVPLDDPLEERPQRPQTLAVGVCREPGAGLVPGLGGEPHLVVLHMRAADVGDDPRIGVRQQPKGELTKGVVGRVDAGRGQEGGDLLEIAAHRAGDARRSTADQGPIGGRLVGGLRFGERAHQPTVS